MEKRKRRPGMDNATLIVTAASIGTANAIALNDVALGFGIALLVFGTVFVVRVIEESRIKAKRDANQDG